MKLREAKVLTGGRGFSRALRYRWVVQVVSFLISGGCVDDWDVYSSEGESLIFL